jgi:hypothetical protein
MYSEQYGKAIQFKQVNIIFYNPHISHLNAKIIVWVEYTDDPHIGALHE